LLFFISLNNKIRTEILKNKVIRQQIENEIRSRLEKISLDPSPLEAVTSKAFFTMALTDSGIKKILLQKNQNNPLPIASITKLMVAVVAMENINLDTVVTATADYVGKEQSAYVLELGKKYTAKELLANTLIASDNDSARLLSSALGENNFIAKMNRKAKEIGMKQTRYVNVTGLDPTDASAGFNASSVNDLANLLIYIKDKHPEILAITSKNRYSFCDTNKDCKDIVNTDKLLDSKNLQFRIIGGKTGSTDLAGKNLALVMRIDAGISLINIVLGSQDNFADSISLINHVRI
jgi:D-alanyl-D-alanine carboxypeptidase